MIYGYSLRVVCKLVSNRLKLKHTYSISEYLG